MLFIEELKRVFKSLIFLGIIVSLIFSITSQIGGDSFELEEPNPDEEFQGIQLTDDLSYIFPNLMMDLYYSVEGNNFTTYPYGFYRQKSLSEDELNGIKDIISDLAGLPYNEIDFDRNLSLPSEEKLETQLDKIDAILGGGSFYAKDKYKVHFGNKGMTYKEAMDDYILMQKTGYDVAFARYFSDYAGIFTLLLSWFIALYFVNKDRKDGIAHTLYVKEVSCVKLVLNRIFAMSLSLMIVILLTFTYYETKLINLYGINMLSPEKAYILVFLWIFPIILFAISLSSFLSIATNGILLGFLGPIFSFAYLMSSSPNIFYNVGYGLVIRYNTIGNEGYFMRNLDVFLKGRVLWIIISILIAILTSFLYERKRRGYNAFKNSYFAKNRIKA